LGVMRRQPPQVKTKRLRRQKDKENVLFVTVKSTNPICCHFIFGNYFESVKRLWLRNDHLQSTKKIDAVERARDSHMKRRVKKILKIMESRVVYQLPATSEALRSHE